MVTSDVRSVWYIYDKETILDLFTQVQNAICGIQFLDSKIGWLVMSLSLVQHDISHSSSARSYPVGTRKEPHLTTTSQRKRDVFHWLNTKVETKSWWPLRCQASWHCFNVDTTSRWNPTSFQLSRLSDKGRCHIVRFSLCPLGNDGVPIWMT